MSEMKIDILTLDDKMVLVTISGDIFSELILGHYHCVPTSQHITRNKWGTNMRKLILDGRCSVSSLNNHQIEIR